MLKINRIAAIFLSACTIIFTIVPGYCAIDGQDSADIREMSFEELQTIKPPRARRQKMILQEGLSL